MLCFSFALVCDCFDACVPSNAGAVVSANRREQKFKFNLRRQIGLASKLSADCAVQPQRAG